MHSKSNSQTLQITKNEVVLLQLIRQLMDELHPVRFSQPIPLDSPLVRDLGLDSLARVEFLFSLSPSVAPETNFGVISGPFAKERSVLSSLNQSYQQAATGRPLSNCVTRFVSKYCATAANLIWPLSTYRFPRWK